MKNKCNVAKDLMPLVIDGVASEESQQYVDEHIAECTECALTYGAMRVELPRANQEKERTEMEKAAKKLRRKHILRGVVGAVLSIVIFMTCCVGGARLLEWYDGKQFVEKYVCENGDLKLDALYYDVSRSSDSMHARVQTDIFSFPSGNPNFELVHKGLAVNDNTALCVQYRAVYKEQEKEGERVYSSGVNAWYGMIEDGKWLGIADDVRGEDGKLASLPIVRIELHAGNDYVVLWEEGDVLQTPQEAKEKREALQAKYEQ